MKPERLEELVDQFSTLSDQEFDAWLQEQPDADALTAAIASLYQTDDPTEEKEEAS